MRLVPCTAPSEPLDAAPQTALLQDAEPGASWDGFWSHSNDSYYARCTSREGAVHWYRISDDEAASQSFASAGVSRVLQFRGDTMRRISLVVASSPSGRPMLVGGTARRSR
jgi:hypothetical protein